MPQTRVKKSNWGLLIIFGTAFVLILILVVVLGVLVFTRQFGSNTKRPDPIAGTHALAQLNIAEIDPALSLTALGGLPEAEVITEALDKARPETALVSLLFTPTLDSRETTGGFLQLAEEYTGIGNLAKAVFSYRMAGTTATLAPDLSDTIRADVFMQAAEGLIDINQSEWAKLYLDQAFIVASKSPYLQAAHRRRIFERLQKNYIIVDERVKARESLNLSANPPALKMVPDETLLLPQGEPIALPEPVQTAEAARWATAQELAVNIVNYGGSAPQEKIEALGQALVAEDMVKLPYYQAEFANATQLSRKVDYIQAQINWLSIKYRVARKGYGLSLVPEWESQAELIRAELTKSYEALYALYADLVVSLPEVAQIDRATEERLRIEILAGELGRYPNYPEEQRRSQLTDATEKLIRTQPEINLFTGVGSVAEQKIYTLISMD